MTITIPREIVALALTLVIEVPIYALLLRTDLEVSPPWGFRYGIGVNLVSHPIAFLVVTRILDPTVGVVAAVVIAEIVVAWLGEAALLGLALRRDFGALVAISFVANAISLALGLVVVRH